MTYVFGVVGNSGRRDVRGSNDWTSSRVRNGLYRVRFNPSHMNPPSVVVSTVNDDQGIVLSVLEPLGREFHVLATGPDGQSASVAFSFIALFGDR